MVRATSFIVAAAIAVCFATGVSGTTVAAASSSPVHNLCYMSWASDPEARRNCVEQQIAGAQTIARYLDWAKTSAGADGRHVVETYELCQSLWLPDYAMMAACLKKRAVIGPPD